MTHPYDCTETTAFADGAYSDEGPWGRDSPYPHVNRFNKILDAFFRLDPLPLP